MSEDKPGTDAADKSWIERLTDAFSSEPKTREDLGAIMEVALENKVIDADAHSIIEGALQVSDMQVRDIMIPRSQMQVIKADATLSEILPQIIRTAHSRYPVVGESPDDIVGVLLAKDLLNQIVEPEGKAFRLDTLLRPSYVVPESKRLNVLLREFRENRNHMAIVIDEYGGVAGLATIEDVLEEIVGDIEDETDELGMELARTLFKHEDEMKPVSVMFWYQIIEWIGDLADYSEKVGDRLRLLIAR